MYDEDVWGWIYITVNCITGKLSEANNLVQLPHNNSEELQNCRNHFNICVGPLSCKLVALFDISCMIHIFLQFFWFLAQAKAVEWGSHFGYKHVTLFPFMSTNNISLITQVFNPSCVE